MKNLFKFFCVFWLGLAMACIPSEVEGVSVGTFLSAPSAIEEYSIPNLNSTYVPQGLCKSTYGKETYRLITAYDYKSKNNSLIYIIDSNGKHLKTAEVEGTKGYHFGGIVEYKDKIWIVSTDKILIVSKDDMFKNLSKKSNKFKVEAEIFDDSIIESERPDLIGKFSFCTVSPSKNILFIGSYHETKSQRANGFVYDKETGKLKHTVTTLVPPKTQGMCFDPDTKYVFFSVNDLLTSEIRQYKITSKNTFWGKTKIYGWTLKYEDDYLAPAMSQGIYCTDKGNVWVLSEGACKRYQNGSWKMEAESMVRLDSPYVVLLDIKY